MTESVQFSLDEEQEIMFKLSVRGSTSDMSNITPTIRFLISEKQGSIAVGLPAKPTENGHVVVVIPPLKALFSESKEYVGKLEIIIGRKYFAPTSMNIRFTNTQTNIAAEHVQPKDIKQISEDVEQVLAGMIEETEISLPATSDQKLQLSKPVVSGVKKQVPRSKEQLARAKLKQNIKKLFL